MPLEFSLETAALLPDCRTWVTSEYEHNGLRMGSGVLDHLLGLLSGRRWLWCGRASRTDDLRTMGAWSRPHPPPPSS